MPNGPGSGKIWKAERLRGFLFLFYTLFLFICHVLPAAEIPPLVARANDKVLHFLNFFLLALLAWQNFFHSSRSFFRNHAGRKAVGFSLLYGAFLEVCQRWVPGRDASFADWLADALGTLAALGIFRISNPKTESPLPLRRKFLSPPRASS